MSLQIVPLTRHQIEILKGVWGNESSQETAQRLSISRRTVDDIKKILVLKTKVKDEASLSSSEVRKLYNDQVLQPV